MRKIRFKQLFICLRGFCRYEDLRPDMLERNPSSACPDFAVPILSVSPRLLRVLGAVVGLAMLLVLDWLLAVASAKLIAGGAGAGAGTGAGVGVCADVGCRLSSFLNRANLASTAAAVWYCGF